MTWPAINIMAALLRGSGAESFDHRARAQLALVCAYLGGTDVALGTAAQALQEAAGGEDGRAWTDAVNACARIYDYAAEEVLRRAGRLPAWLPLVYDIVDTILLPHHYLAAAWFDWSCVDYERGRRHLAEGRRFGELFENPWALREADDLEPRLSGA